MVHRRHRPMGDLPPEMEGKTVGPAPGSEALKYRKQALEQQRSVINDINAVNAGHVIGTESVQVLVNNINRRYLLVQNNSAATIYLSFSNKANTFDGLKIISGGYYEPFIIPRSAVYLIAAAANSNVVVVEGFGGR